MNDGIGVDIEAEWDVLGHELERAGFHKVRVEGDDLLGCSIGNDAVVVYAQNAVEIGEEV